MERWWWKIETLKEIIKVLRTTGISIAGITFVVLMIKFGTDPDNKAKYIKLTKHLLIATVLITLSLSLVEIPRYYFGSTVEITDGYTSDLTIGKIEDKDCQGRETINIDGKWYVVTDTEKEIGAPSEDSVLEDLSTIKIFDKTRVIKNVSFLRLFSECQGTFKGYFAEIAYYRDENGLIFPKNYTYLQYQVLKASQGNGGIMYNAGGNRRR